MSSTLYRGAYRDSLDDTAAIAAAEAARSNAIALAAQGEKPSGDLELDAEMAEPVETVEEKTFKQRYGDLRRHMSKRDQEHKEQMAALQRQIDEVSRAKVSYPKSDEELDAWMQEFPDAARIFETIAMKKADERTKQIEERFKEVDTMKARTAREKAEFELMKAHPDFGAIRDDESFHAWAATKSRSIRDALYNNDTDWQAAAEAIDLFKAQTGYGKPKRGRPSNEDVRAAAEATPRGNRAEQPTVTDGKKRWKESEIAKLRSREFELHYEDIEAARREGRIINDLRGGAAG
jgi:hypothetical protein